MKIEINSLDDLEKYSKALLSHEESKLYEKQRIWHPIAVASGIIIASISATLIFLKVAGVI